MHAGMSIKESKLNNGRQDLTIGHLLTIDKIWLLDIWQDVQKPEAIYYIFVTLFMKP